MQRQVFVRLLLLPAASLECHVEVMFVQLLNLLERYYVYLHLCLLCNAIVTS